VSGFLIYENTNVFQYLEGSTEIIDQLVINIKGDKRQIDFITIITGHLKQRICPSGWDMRHATYEEYTLKLRDI